MSEQNGFLTTQKKVSFNVDEDFKKLFNRVADYLGLDEDNYGLTDVIQTVFKRIDQKFKPVINEESKLKSKIEQLTKELSEAKELKEINESIDKELQYYMKENKLYENNIAELQEKIKELESNNTDISEITEKHNAELSGLLAEKTAIEQKLSAALEQLNNKIELSENQVILSLTDIQKYYLQNLIKDKRFVLFLKEANKKGKFDAIIKPLIAEEKEDTGRALLGWLFYSAKLNKYPLISFDKWYKSNKQTKKEDE